MTRGARLALIWLAMIALPLYGMAGVARMPTCVTMSSQPSIDAANPHGATMILLSVAGASMHDPCAGADAKAHHARSLHGKCTPSAACSLVAAPALAGPSVVIADGVTDTSSPAPTPSIAFLTGAPERPPRS